MTTWPPYPKREPFYKHTNVYQVWGRWPFLLPHAPLSVLETCHTFAHACQVQDRYPGSIIKVRA